MPWGVRRKGDKWETYNRDTGRVAGTHDSRIKADRQRRLLEMIRHGKKPTGKEARE